MSIRFANPHLFSLVWNINQVQEQEAVGQPTPQGMQRVRNVLRKQGLMVEFDLHLNGLSLTGADKGVKYTFGLDDDADEPMKVSTVMTNAGGDVAPAWEQALNGMTATFPLLVAPTVEQSHAGIPVYMRLDQWQAQLGSGTRSIVAMVGVYGDADYNQGSLLTYRKLWFGNSDAHAVRNARLAQLQANIDRHQEIVDTAYNAETVQATEEEYAAHQVQAAAQVLQLQAQWDSMQAEEVGSMESLLGGASIQTAVGALMHGVFATLRAEAAGWDDVSQEAVMLSFTDAMTAMLTPPE